MRIPKCRLLRGVWILAVTLSLTLTTPLSGTAQNQAGQYQPNQPPTGQPRQDPAGRYYVRQHYGPWSFYPDRKYYWCRYYFSLQQGARTYQYHYCIYYPSRSQYIFYYDPAGRVYWGRFDREAKGFSMLQPAERNASLNQIAAGAYAPAGAMPAIPGSRGEAAIEQPPAPPQRMPGEGSQTGPSPQDPTSQPQDPAPKPNLQPTPSETQTADPQQAVDIPPPPKPQATPPETNPPGRDPSGAKASGTNPPNTNPPSTSPPSTSPPSTSPPSTSPPQQNPPEVPRKPLLKENDT